MKLTNKRALGALAFVLGLAIFVVSVLAWSIGPDFNTWIQAGFAASLVCFAAAAALEIDLVTRTLKSRQARFGAEAIGISIAFVVVLGLLNFILNQDRLKQRWDLTETGEHSLAPETIEILNELPDGIQVLGFYGSTSALRNTAEDLLESYVFHSGGTFSYEFHDPDLELILAQQYEATPNSLIVELDGRRETVDFANEQSLTAALIRVVHPTDRAISFVTGHQEKDHEEFGDAGISQVATSLERVGFTLSKINLLFESLPEDIDVLVLAGPLTPYSQEEVDKIADFLDQGGSVVYLAEPTLIMIGSPESEEPLHDYLADEWGIRLTDDIIIDSIYSAPQSPFWPASDGYGFSPVTQELGLPTFYPESRSIAFDADFEDPITITSLVQTSPNAWGESDFSTLEDLSMQPDGADAIGPLHLGVSAENAETGARLLVFGDSDFPTNVMRNIFGNGVDNTKLFENASKWASVEDELINLTPAPTVFRSHNISTVRDIAIVFLLACVLPPGIVVAVGGSVWWHRRRMV